MFLEVGLPAHYDTDICDKLLFKINVYKVFFTLNTQNILT